MYQYLKGEYTETFDNYIVVECAQIGYRVNTTLTTMRKMPPMGTEVKIYTYLHIREDIMELYGFIDLDELDCFKMLISVSGVGPKAAVSILSQLTPRELYVSISSGDIKPLTAAQGIGPKMAQRIILELKDKIKNEKLGLPLKGAEGYSGTVDKADEAINALISLGYTKGQAATTVRKMDTRELSIEDIIRFSLTELMR